METKHIKESLEIYGKETVERMAKALNETYLSSRLGYKIDETNEGFNLYITMPASFTWVDSGRKAGKAPPPNVIESWMKKRGISPYQGTYKTAAFLIGRKIARVGIKPRPFIKIFYDHIQELNKMLGIGASIDLANSLQVIFDDAGVGDSNI